MILELSTLSNTITSVHSNCVLILIWYYLPPSLILQRDASMLSTFQECGRPTRFTAVLNFIKSFPASDTYRMFSASTLAFGRGSVFYSLKSVFLQLHLPLTSTWTLPEVVRLMSMVSRRIRRHFPKTFAPTCYLVIFR